ncbi:acylglycerol kinase family protein [Dactylosporangium sp. NBC_01737]|uniref:diacylglycerol kinase family protein n=1 Tax=Dactylosporangium sp. NBC_01737 TaxID=2975959 RepID=UPI002E11051B|nr:acylglycerol kinase family protein [Dactylosporangium sp. NBC_01737]
MVDVVMLALGEGTSCACENGACGTRTPILACRDALRTASVQVETVVAHTDTEIDAALKALPDVRLIVATAADGQLRAVMRRLVRMYAPAPSKRSLSQEAIPDDRTLPDLPPIGVLPLGPDSTDLVSRLGLPRTPADIAAAVLGGNVRRLDLLRNDAGSVTLDGVLVGGVDASGSASTYLARVEVDDTVLADGTEPVLMSVVANASRYATVDGLPLVLSPDMSDGIIDVAVAVPRASRSLFRRPRVEIEVRRAHGRAVAITPRVDVPFVDDGAEGTLTRKRSWWMERSAWAVYVP